MSPSRKTDGMLNELEHAHNLIDQFHQLDQALRQKLKALKVHLEGLAGRLE